MSSARRGRDISAPSVWLRDLFGENGLQKWVFYIPVVFFIMFFALPMLLTVVWSVFERTMFWMEPGFTLFAYENFFTSARAENYVFSMLHSAVAATVSFIIGFPIAVFVRRRVAQAAQHRVILLFILPFMISELVRVFAMRPVLGRNGVLNNLLIDYPGNSYREEAHFLILKSSYELAINSISTKIEERLQNTLDAYLVFNDNYPESKYIKQAQKIEEQTNCKVAVISTSPEREHTILLDKPFK